MARLLEARWRLPMPKVWPLPWSWRRGSRQKAGYPGICSRFDVSISSRGWATWQRRGLCEASWRFAVWLAATSPWGCLSYLVLLLSFWAMLALHAKLSWRKCIRASGGTLFMGPGRREGSVCDVAGHVLRGVPWSSTCPSLRARGRIWPVAAPMFSRSTSTSSTSLIDGRLPGMQNGLNRYRQQSTLKAVGPARRWGWCSGFQARVASIAQPQWYQWHPDYPDLWKFMSSHPNLNVCLSYANGPF
jgi:hypothetical protein